MGTYMFNIYHVTYYFESDNKTARNGYYHQQEIFHLYRFIYLNLKFFNLHNDMKLPVPYIARYSQDQHLLHWRYLEGYKCLRLNTHNIFHQIST